VYFGSRHVNLKPDKPIKTPADLAGIKLRMPPGEFWQFLGESLGANPTPVAYAELYTALQTGTVDAAENGVNVYLANKHYEVAPVLSMTEHEANNNCIWVSDKTWNSLTPEQQGWVQGAADEVNKTQPAKAVELEHQSQDKLKAIGVKVVTDVDKSGFVAVADPYLDKLAKELGPEAEKILKLVRNIK
jgi:TRAP-type C4-dicarboxylate transport system substrate-binding protein